MTRQVTIIVDGRPVVAVEGESLLEVLLAQGIDIPHLCHHRALEPYGACRLCLVEVNRKGWKPQWRKITTSCNFPVMSGLTVYTGTERVKKHLKTTLTLMLAEAPMSSRIRELAGRHGVTIEDVEARFEDLDRENLCIRCGLCARICERMGHYAIATMGRGGRRNPGAPLDQPPPDCVGCAACANVCPTRCIPVTMVDGKRVIWKREFAMVQCSVCHKAYITEEQAMFEARRAGLDESYFETCDECSRREIARRFLEHVI